MTIADPDPVRPFGGGWRVVADVLAACITLLAIAWAMSLPRMLGIGLYPQQFFAALLALTLPLAFLILPARKGADAPDGAVDRRRPRRAVGRGLLLCRRRLPLARAADLLAPAGDLAPRHRHRAAHARGAPARHRLGAGRHHLRVPALRAVRRHGARAAAGPAAELAAPRGLHGGRFERHPRPADLGRGDRGGGLHPVRHAPRASPAARSSSPTPR